MRAAVGHRRSSLLQVASTAVRARRDVHEVPGSNVTRCQTPRGTTSASPSRRTTVVSVPIVCSSPSRRPPRPPRSRDTGARRRRGGPPHDAAKALRGGDHPDRIAVDPVRRSRWRRRDRCDACTRDVRHLPHEGFGRVLDIRCHHLHIAQRRPAEFREHVRDRLVVKFAQIAGCGTSGRARTGRSACDVGRLRFRSVVA